jgi:hypothetical protein
MKRLEPVNVRTSGDVLHSTPVRSKRPKDEDNEPLITITESPIKAGVTSKPIDIPASGGGGNQLKSLWGDGERKRNYESSLTAFQVGSDEVLFHLGAQKYLIISRTDGPFRVNRIRICDLASHPSKKKKVIRFNLQQWIDLTCLHPSINDVIEKEEEEEGSAISGPEAMLRWSVGGNVYVTARRGMPGLDFRWFWLPPDEATDYHQQPHAFKVHPTKYGIWLNYDEWARVTSLKGVVAELIPDLADMSECQLEHNTQIELLMCAHCNPNGHHVWQ